MKKSTCWRICDAVLNMALFISFDYFCIIERNKQYFETVKLAQFSIQAPKYY